MTAERDDDRRPPQPHPLMHWARWGDPGEERPLDDGLRGLVGAFLGLDGADTPAVAMDAVRLPAPALSPEALAALRDLLGTEHVRLDDESRVRHTGGKSTPDLLHLRLGDGGAAPDAVVLPADHEQVVALVALAAEHRLALVPFGGGTSVVGGLGLAAEEAARYAGVLALDLGRLDRLVDLDEVSGIAWLEPGLRGPEAERLLGERGWTIGHFPQSFEYATIGGFAAARSSGQSSAGYGRFDANVVALTAATGIGTLKVGSSPANAAGPDLRQLMLGSEGAFGVITKLGVQVRRAPVEKVYTGWRFPDLARGMAALRALAQGETQPTVLRLSDETETLVGLADPDSMGAADGAGCLVIAGYEGTAATVAVRREACEAVLAAAGGQPLGEEPGRAWADGRFHGPYLRDQLLDAGALVETFETATFWSNAPHLYAAAKEAVTAALTAQGTPPLVLCHLSHVYATGTSLYFTVAARRLGDGLDQWAAAKAAATAALVEHGGTVSHHHAVGRDHKPWLAAEIGEVGVEILRAVKARLDPAGVLNPGVLVP